MMRNCRCDDKRLSSVFVLGEILVALASEGDEETRLERKAPEFVSEVQAALSQGFESLRGEADASGERDVLKFLSGEAACRKMLGLLLRPVRRESPDAGRPVQPALRGDVALNQDGSVEALRFLTWNICGDTKAWTAPLDEKAWNETDKRARVQQ